MLRIRTITTGSGAKAVQVIYYLNRKRIVFKHIGSAKSEEDLKELLILAEDFIHNYTPELPFEEEVKFDNLMYLHKTQFIGVYYTYAYEILLKTITQIGLNKVGTQLLLDLIVLRIIEPVSKLRSIELLNEYFGIKHRRQSFYKSAPSWLTLKNSAEEIIIEFAKKSYDFTFDLVFYDITTLYFEAFQEDELRKNGFSKDNKSQQPQILVALMVSKEGFPVSYEIFPGNTFEGHTILPVVQSFIQKHSVKKLTIVADAAMISMDNVQKFNQDKLNYIVGARIANLPTSLINFISKSLNKEDGKNIRVQTDKGHLICSFSSVRFRKDKYEMDKQIEKAKTLVQTPSKCKKLKFTTVKAEKVKLNKELIEKTTKILGIKGYYTNLSESEVSNDIVITQYHELYRIEQAFRVAKSDLQTRPIFHYKEDPVKLHLLICFITLSVAKHIELQTGISIKRFKNELKKVTDARMLNQLTNKEIKIRTQITPYIQQIIDKLNLPH